MDADQSEGLHHLTNLEYNTFKTGESFAKTLEEFIRSLDDIKLGKIVLPKDTIPDTDWSNSEEVRKLNLMVTVIPSLIAQIARENNIEVLRLVAPQFLADDKTNPA
jgi:hypothetical protein